VLCASRSSRSTGCPIGTSWLIPSGPGPDTASRYDGHFAAYASATACTSHPFARRDQPSATYSHSGAGRALSGSGSAGAPAGAASGSRSRAARAASFVHFNARQRIGGVRLLTNSRVRASRGRPLLIEQAPGS
jgi:hypothetical protein